METATETAAIPVRTFENGAALGVAFSTIARGYFVAMRPSDDHTWGWFAGTFPDDRTARNWILSIRAIDDTSIMLRPRLKG